MNNNSQQDSAQNSASSSMEDEPQIADQRQEDQKSQLRQAREEIQVGARGIVPTDFAKQVDYAKDLSRAELMPPHARNPANMLVLLDIAIRSDLSPYQVASQTYMQNGVLNFMSQLHHAMLEGSGMLEGDLLVDYEGDGGDLVCIVTGRLRSDPHTKRVHRSPRLGDLHPGYSVKRREDSGATAKRFISYAAGQTLKTEGLPEGTELFAKGSPLWDRKPRVQMFYDTSRDWGRIYAPRATLGMYTPEELGEYGPQFARDVTPKEADTSALADRLAKAATKLGEDDWNKTGFHADVVEQGLNPTPAQLGREASGRVLPKPKAKTAVKAKIAPPPAPAEPERPSRLKEDLEASVAAEAEAKPDPKTVKQYAAHFKAWLAGSDLPVDIKTRWKAERPLRNRCNLTAEDREPLEIALRKRLAELMNDVD